MKAILNFTLLVLPFAFAKEGDSCAFNGLKGTCQNVSKCTSGKERYGLHWKGYLLILKFQDLLSTIFALTTR